MSDDINTSMQREQKQFCIHGCVGTCHYMQPGRDDKHDCCPYGHEPMPVTDVPLTQPPAKSEQPTSDTPRILRSIALGGMVDIDSTKGNACLAGAKAIEELAAAKAEVESLKRDVDMKMRDAMNASELLAHALQEVNTLTIDRFTPAEAQAYALYCEFDESQTGPMQPEEWLRKRRAAFLEKQRRKEG